MIGLDTNVLVRYIVRDDARQAALSDKLIEAKCTNTFDRRAATSDLFNMVP